MFKYIQNKNFAINGRGDVSFALTALAVTDFCFSSFPKSLLLVFVLVPKHFSPCMSEGSWSLHFLCSHVTFFCHRRGLGPSQPQHGLSNHWEPSIFSHNVIWLPSLFCCSIAICARSLCFALTLKASVVFHLEFECETSSMQIYRVVPAFIADLKRSPSAMCDILRDRYSSRMVLQCSGTFQISSITVPAVFLFNERPVYIWETAGGSPKRTRMI